MLGDLLQKALVRVLLLAEGRVGVSLFPHWYGAAAGLLSAVSTQVGWRLSTQHGWRRTEAQRRAWRGCALQEAPDGSPGLLGRALDRWGKIQN